MDIFYVYALVDSQTKQTFYIGKGSGDRMFRHVQKRKRGETTQNPHLDHKIDKLLRENIAIEYIKLYEKLAEDDAFSKEAEVIECVGIKNLCNVWFGGFGGRVPSDEVRQKISEANLGRVVSEATREKMRNRKLGTEQTEEWKQRQSELKKGKPQTNKQKTANEQRSKSLLGRKFSEEHKQKLREAKIENPTKFWLGKQHTNETKKQISETLKRKRTPNEQETGITE